MGIRWTKRGVAAILLAAALTGAPAGAAVAAGGPAAGGAGGHNFSWPMGAEFAAPVADHDVARRQALGCTVVGLGVTGLAMASGAMATAGSGGTAAVPIGTVVGEILAYFGAGCTIGAFLAGLFPATGADTVEVGGEAGG